LHGPDHGPSPAAPDRLHGEGRGAGALGETLKARADHPAPPPSRRVTRGIVVGLLLLSSAYGLILGQAVVGSLWSLVSVFTGLRMYSFWGY
jgi:hypothetical protein